MRTVLIDTEGGATSVRDKAGPDLEIKAPRIDSTFRDLEEFFWELRDRIDVDVVVIDTLTTLSTTTRQDVIADPKDLAGKRLWDLRDKLQPRLQDWGVTSDLLARLLRLYRGLPCHTIFTAHAREREDPMSGKSKESPDLNPALLADVVAFTDYMFHLGILPSDADADGRVIPAGTRRLRLKANDTYASKARTAGGIVLPPVMWDPTFPQLLALLHTTKPVKLVVYGSPGAGKTVFACSGAGSEKGSERVVVEEHPEK